MQKMRRIVCLICCALMLEGCTARELQDRIFPQAMELELRGDGTLEGGFGEFLVSGENVAQICKNYQDNIDKYLDLGHIKAIVFGKRLLANHDAARQVLDELDRMPLISRNCIVFTRDYASGESYLKELTDSGKEPGEFLCDLYENNPARAETSAVTLGDMV